MELDVHETADQENKKKTKKSHNYCDVYGCKSFYLTECISFHKLPNLNEPKILWKNSLGIEELVNRRSIWAVKLKLSKEALTKKQLQVCSKHFTPNDYLPGFNRKRQRLRPFAVPSLNLPKSSVILSSPKKRSTKKKTESQDQIEDECHDETLNIGSFLSIQMDDDSLKSKQTNDLTVANNITNQLKTTQDNGTQESSGNRVAPLISLRGSNRVRKSLRPSAVSSLNLPKSSVILSSPKKRSSKKKTESQDQIEDECHDETLNIGSFLSIQMDDDSLKSNQTNDLTVANNITNQLKTTQDNGTQVLSGNRVAPLISLRGSNRIRKSLRPSAVSSLNLPKSSVILSSPKKRSSQKKTESQDQIEDECHDENLNLSSSTSIQMDDDSLKSNQTNDLTVANNITNQLKTTQDNGTQVSSGGLVVPLISLIDNKKKLITMTGICSFNVLNEIINLHKQYFSDKRTHRLNLKERIIMVFLKLKQGLSFAILSILFNDVTSETCRLTYNLMIPQLAQIMHSLVYCSEIKTRPPILRSQTQFSEDDPLLSKNYAKVMSLVRDKSFERIIKFSKQNMSNKLKQVIVAHNKSTKITPDMVVEVNGNWLVNSETDIHIQYRVEKTTLSCDCLLRCNVCKICVHTYKCTCMNYVTYFNICKHIHACAKRQPVTDLETVQNENQSFQLHKQEELKKNENINKNNEEIKHKLEMILGTHSRVNMNEVEQMYIIKQCNNILTTLGKEIDFKKTSNLQLAKKRKIEPQTKFFTNQYPTLSSIAGAQIRESLKNSTEVISTTPMFDHSYF